MQSFTFYVFPGTKFKRHGFVQHNQCRTQPETRSSRQTISFALTLSSRQLTSILRSQINAATRAQPLRASVPHSPALAGEARSTKAVIRAKERRQGTKVTARNHAGGRISRAEGPSQTGQRRAPPQSWHRRAEQRSVADDWSPAESTAAVG